jgi:hypothetical protein
MCGNCAVTLHSDLIGTNSVRATTLSNTKNLECRPAAQRIDRPPTGAAVYLFGYLQVDGALAMALL